MLSGTYYSVREGRKKERETWQSLKARMDDPGGPEPESSNDVKMSGRQPGGEAKASCSSGLI